MAISEELAKEWAAENGYYELQLQPGQYPSTGGQWYGYNEANQLMPVPLPQEFFEWARAKRKAQLILGWIQVVVEINAAPPSSEPMRSENFSVPRTFFGPRIYVDFPNRIIRDECWLEAKIGDLVQMNTNGFAGEIFRRIDPSSIVIEAVYATDPPNSRMQYKYRTFRREPRVICNGQRDNDIWRRIP